MSDFDPDAYLQQPSGGAPAAAFDPDAYLAQSGPASKSASGTVKTSHTTMVGGALETGAHYLSGIAALPVKAGASLYKLATSPAGTRASEAAKASQAVQAAMTYQPRTAEGQAMTDAADKVMGIPERLGDAAVDAIAGPDGSGNEGLAAGADVAINAVPALFGVRGVRGIPGQVGRALGAVDDTVRAAPRGWAGSAPTTAQDVLSQAARNSPQSMGAASAAPRMQQVSPELQQAVVNAARQNGGAVAPETLGRHVEADSLPVKVQLTPGQASQDPALISHEMNNRGKIAGLPELLNDQNKKLTQNVQAIRDEIGPDVFSKDHVEHADTLIQAYKDKDAPVVADIQARYKALEDANGGQFPLDTKAFVTSTDVALSKALKTNSLPSDLAASLNEFRNGRTMTFEDFESLRSDAADAMRTATDGRQRAAAGIVRAQLENLPLSAEAAKLKPLADAARSAAKARFDALEADPAYDAAVHDTVPPDRFIQKFVIGGTRDNVALMRENLKDNETATQTMGVAALDHLRDAAGITPRGDGTFGQSGFNKHLEALSPKLNSLVTPKIAEQLETLGNVARYTQAQPKGSFVNNSNTLVGAIANHAANAAEGIANVKAGGLPVGTIGRKFLQGRADAKIAKETMTPYGGLTSLPEAPKK